MFLNPWGIYIQRLRLNRRVEGEGGGGVSAKVTGLRYSNFALLFICLYNNIALHPPPFQTKIEFSY